MPKISVIIPVYNSEKYLRQCLDSVINQSFKDIEIICVDDGSTDSSKNILEEYAKKDNRIIIINQQNSYTGVARNNGIKIAKGDYIHFLDADDWIKDNTYEYLYKKMVEQDVDVIVFQYDEVDMQSKKILPRRKVLRKNNQISNIKEKPYFFIYGSVVAWNKFYNRKFIIDNKLEFEPVITVEDRSFYIKTILAAKKIMVSKKSFLYYRVNNIKSSSGTVRLKNYECHFETYETIKRACENIKPNEKSMIIDITMKDFLYFYHQANGEYKDEIYKKLHDYFQTMDVSVCEHDSKKYIWWNEYMAIKTGDMETVEKEFRINRIMNNDKKNRNIFYLKKTIKYLREYGICYTARFIFSNIRHKLEK